METLVDSSCTGGTLGCVPMGRGIPAPTPPDIGWDVGALPPVPSACDRSHASQGRLMCVNQAAPHACPHRIKCGEGRLGRHSFKTLGCASCSAHLAATWQPGEGLGVVCSKGPRDVTRHPEAPWPLHNRLTFPPRGGGGRKATRPRGQVERLFPSTVRTPGPISPIIAPDTTSDRDPSRAVWRGAS